jgi:hypothetical protein
LVGKALRDRLIKRHQQLPRGLAQILAKEFAKPLPELSVINVMASHIRSKIWYLFFGVTKGMETRVLFDPEVGSVSGRMVKPNSRFELKRTAGRVEIEKGYAISEDVVYPSDIGWLRRHFQLAIQQTLIETVARPKH